MIHVNHIRFGFYNIKDPESLCQDLLTIENSESLGLNANATEKGIKWHIDASNEVWTVFDNDKLANQIDKNCP